MCNGTPFSGRSRAFSVLVSTATASERFLSPGTGVVLEVVRISNIELVPPLMTALHAGSKATDRRPYSSLETIAGC